jgi:hypothetical protein
MEVTDDRWEYKTDRDKDATVRRYKARYVGKGFSHVSGLDYTDTFALVAQVKAIRALLEVENTAGELVRLGGSYVQDGTGEYGEQHGGCWDTEGHKEGGEDRSPATGG